MTDGRHRDSESGQFVTAEAAVEDPAGTTFDTWARAEPDQLDADLAWIEQTVDSRPLWRVTVLGEQFEHTDPREAIRLARLHVERVTGGAG